jgi:ABC-2 type transport system ATP-binding protein
MHDPIAVDVRALTKKFKAFTAVDQVSFQVMRGEIFGFLGPNGSGKTTTIRMLCGVLLPTSGEARVLDFDVRTQPESIKPVIGYMAQKFALYNDLSAQENLEFYADIYGVPLRARGARVRELIEMAGLKGREKERVGQLSGAWRQRLALGCSIVHRPQVLFLDEPTAGVDPVSRRRFWDMIYALAAGGVTVFVTTHYMDEAERCNRVALMYNSKLLTVDEPDTLKSRLSGVLLEIDAQPLGAATDVLASLPQVQEVVAHGHMLHAMVDERERESASARPPVARMAVRDAGAVQPAIAALTAALEAKGVHVDHIEPIMPSLEDVFISMIEVERRAQVRAGLQREDA